MPTVGDLIRYLDDHATDSRIRLNPASGPIRPIRCVPFRALQTSDGKVPEKLLKLFSQISTSAAPYDAAERRNDVNDETFGAMRQIHSNDPPWLPPLTAPDLSKYDDKGGGSRQAAFNHYVVSYKRQTNGNGGGNAATGYIEYTAGEQGLYSKEPEVRGGGVNPEAQQRLRQLKLHSSIHCRPRTGS